MEQIKKIIGMTTSEQYYDDVKKVMQQKCARMNEIKGDLNKYDGYDCPLCLNRGGTYEVREYDGRYYETFVHCKCQRIRKAIRRLNKSGLKDAVKKYTFDNFTTDEEWQAKIKNEALDYIENGYNRWFYLGGQSGCVDCDTEYFNGTEWVKISDYKDDDKVLQYNPTTRAATLTKPVRYIAKPADKLYQISTMRGSIDMCLSADHNFAYITSRGHMQKKPFSEVMKLHNENIQGFYGKIETAFDYSGSGIDLTENEIRLMCAVMADGCFKKKVNFCDVNVKKERKKERMRELLKDIPHKEYQKSNGYSLFRFYAPRKEKEFTAYWYNCTKEQLEIIVDEVFNWDGSVNGARKSYFTTIKKSADFIQFALSATGKRATIGVDNRNNENKKVCYTVLCTSGKSTVSMVSTGGRTKATITEVKPKDNMQYCFTVDTGYLILRRNGRIFITGNCGKTHVCTAIAIKLLKQGYDTRYMLWRDEAAKLKSLVNDTEEYEKMINEIKNADVLYIDDLFKTGKADNGKAQKPTPADINLAFEILNYRYNKNLPYTIISSECTLSDLIKIDEAISGRIAEKALNGGNWCLSIRPDTAKNYRFKGVTEL